MIISEEHLISVMYSMSLLIKHLQISRGVGMNDI
jgi:hypothetical protein